MRIITGEAKGIQLKAPEGETTRPTASRVKEAVFSMLQFDIEGRSVLDLFAGSGQLGLEAASRGASDVTFADKSKEAILIIKDNIKKTRLDDRCSVYQTDYMDFIKRVAAKKFDIIFLDPPYAMKMYKPAIKAMLENDILKPTTLIVCESNMEEIFDGDENLKNKFQIEKQSRYSKTVINIFKLKAEE